MTRIFVRTIIYNGRLNGNDLSTRLGLYKNRKPKSSMPLSPKPDSLVE